MIVPISRGYQLTIPASIRKEFDLGIGSRLDIKKSGNKIIMEPIDVDVDEVFANAKKIKPKYGLNAKEMDNLIEK